MKNTLTIAFIAVLITFTLACHHKTNDVITTTDTTASANYRITISPFELPLYNLSVPYNQLVTSGLNLSTPLTVTKQISNVTGSSKNIYQFSFQRDTSLAVSFPVVTDSLTTTYYNYDSLYAKAYASPTSFINFSLNKVLSTVYYQSDNCSINITSYSAGKIAGNFLLRLTPIFSSLNYTYRGSVYLEGSFQNIPINYK